MKEYTKTNPVYSPKIQIVETTDPAHADNVNAAPKQLLENTMANRQSIERLEATTGIAEGDYNAGNAYHTGDFCLYDNNLYKCIKDTTGAWDAGSWKVTSPLEEIESLRRSLNALDTLMGGATQSKAGTAGLVPAPAAGAQGKYLRGDGTWQTPPDTNTTYGAATQSVSGLMTPADKRKLDGVSANANNYSHPTTAGNNHIPAGGAVGNFLKWLRDGVAQWASLGAAAMYNVSNNDTTTEEGFLADARRIKALRDDVNALNSALKFNVPNYKNLLTTISGEGKVYTATEDCWCSYMISNKNITNGTIMVYVDDVQVASIQSTATETYIGGLFPLAKGQTMRTRNTSGGFYNINIYSV